MKERVLTGYRPTGKLHLGHWFGNLQNMLALQDEYEAFYFVADWHALTSEWQNPADISRYTEEMVLDWVAAGLDPDKCVIYRQSDIPEVAELLLYFSMVTPMSWLERTPSYKEQQQQIGDKDLSNVGFFTYPALQAADIVAIEATRVPVGEDQLPHIELAREIVRRFNGTYKAGKRGLVEPKALLAKVGDETMGARVPGTDGRKMSKSYGNAIFINDSPDEIRKKAMGFMTDPARKQLTDPGNPDVCPLHQVYKLVAESLKIEKWEECCRAAACGCVPHKKEFAEDIISYLADFQKRRTALEARPDYAREVLEAGAAKARPIAQATVARCRELVGL
ncbi:MAG: tryptophan--tRNA ligase [Coriobacteriia bacterium]|nr:tryptophan--tRNA ligase [Coriobacteriia bacterium]MCL2745785.1 tryptophan--tRNA ligase [Coriobacteriia bacterium]MCL2870262.1 tryptophan--tRNA ligase [Coriobacteriia bacterium]